MKHYQTLIKIKQKEIDALTKQIGNLRQQRAILEQLMTNLQNELIAEVEAANSYAHLGAFFGDYSESNKQKQLNVSEKMQQIDDNINIITEKMMLIYGEKKKFELALENRLREKAYAMERKEQQFLDELAITRHLEE
jgi:flagellar biosynthesis chaperone FliJ